MDFLLLQNFVLTQNALHMNLTLPATNDTLEFRQFRNKILLEGGRKEEGEGGTKEREGGEGRRNE